MRIKLSTAVAVQFIAGAVLFSAAISESAQVQTDRAPSSAVTGVSAGQITFSVQDIDLVTDFWVKDLGFKVVRTATPRPGFTVRTLTIPGFAIDLVKISGSALPSWTYSRYMQQGYVHFALYTTDILGSLEKLQKANADVTPLKGDNGAVNRLIIHDPEGNEFELFIPPKY